MNHLIFEMSFSQFSEYGNECLPTTIVMMWSSCTRKVKIIELDNWIRNAKVFIMVDSDGSGPKPGPGPARSPGFLESPRPDIGRRAQARARPEPVVKSPGAQRALGIWLSFKKLALLWKILSKNIKSQMQIIFFAIFSLSLVPLFIFQVFCPMHNC